MSIDRYEERLPAPYSDEEQRIAQDVYRRAMQKFPKPHSISADIDKLSHMSRVSKERISEIIKNSDAFFVKEDHIVVLRTSVVIRMCIWTALCISRLGEKQYLLSLISWGFFMLEWA